MEIQSILRTAAIVAIASGVTYLVMDSRQPAIANASSVSVQSVASATPPALNPPPAAPAVTPPSNPCLTVPRPVDGPQAGLVGKHFESFTGTHYEKIPYRITITGVLDAAEANGKMLISPNMCAKANSQGFAMIVLMVEIFNSGSSQWHCPGSDFVLIAADGRKAKPLDAPREYEFCNEMDAGAKAKYPLIFRIPMDFRAVELQRTSTFFTGKLSLP